MSLGGRDVMRQRRELERRRRREQRAVEKSAHDHHRVSPEGKALGASMARIAEKVIAYAAANGLPDQRCVSCAFRPGTVPNGCAQTQADAFKAVLEGVPFMCHQTREPREYCYGWAAARIALHKAGVPRSVSVPLGFLAMSHVIQMTFGGVTKPLPVWARERGYSLATLRSRLNHGWTDEQALTIPIGKLRPGQFRGRAAAKAKRLAQSPAVC